MISRGSQAVTTKNLLISSIRERSAPVAFFAGSGGCGTDSASSSEGDSLAALYVLGRNDVRNFKPASKN